MRNRTSRETVRCWLHDEGLVWHRPRPVLGPKDPQRSQKREYMAKEGHCIVLHFLPTHAPETNPIEEVWWHLHEEITRHHRCRNIEELLDLVFGWLSAAPCFEIETSFYDAAPAA